MDARIPLLRQAAAAAGAANASSTSSGGPESGRGGGKPVPGAYAPPRVLGRGAFGVVVLGECVCARRFTRRLLW